jgi:hypothetical protein
MRLDFQTGIMGLIEKSLEPNRYDGEEEYLPDERVDQRPSDVVQTKLINLLPRGVAIPVSCLHNHRDCRR